MQNLRSRDIEAQVRGRKRPLFEGHLLDRDLHISEFEIPLNSAFAGKSLARLQWGARFGVLVSSILRGYRRINIPGGSTILFPKDKIQVIGNDEQLHAFGIELSSNLVPEDPNIEKREMGLHSLVIHAGSAFVGKTLEGKNIIAIMDNALCTSGFEQEGKNKEGAVGKYTFECHADLTSDLDKLPWHIYYPKASEI